MLRGVAVRAGLYALGYILVAGGSALLTGDAGFLAPLGVYALWLLPGYLLAAAAHPAQGWPFHVAAGFLYSLGVLALVAVPAFLLHLPFAWAFAASIALWAVALAVGATWLGRSGRPSAAADRSRVLEAVFLLSVAALVFVGRPHFWAWCSGDRDTFHYAVLAQGMIGSDALHARDLLCGSGAPVPARFLLDAIGFLAACVARVTGLHAAPVLLADFPVVVSLLIPCAGYAVSSALFGGRTWGLAGGALAALPCALLSGDKEGYTGTDALYSLLHRLPEDKTVLVLVAIPTAIALAIEVCRERGRARWLLYLAACVGLLALHPFAVPFLLFHVVLWATCARAWRAGALLAAPLLLLCGVVFWLRSRYATSLAGIEALPMARLAVGEGVWVRAREMFLAVPFFYIVAPLAAWALVGLRRRPPHERYLVAATLAPIALAFLPPFPWLLTRIVPGGILYRVLWLIPALPATLWAIEQASRAVPRVQHAVARLLVAALLCLAVLPRLGEVSGQGPSAAGAPSHAIPDVEVVRVARWVGGRLDAAGGGPVLAPVALNNTIALLRPGTPLFGVRNRFFSIEPFAAAGRRDEGEARFAFGRRVYGGREPEGQLFVELARYRVGLVVLRTGVDDAVRAALVGRGWTSVHASVGWEVLEHPSKRKETARKR
ncbi:MAG: DUF6077 domain-containing protein [Planctomycetota bacterium]